MTYRVANIRIAQPFQFYSCFISHSSKDKAFAEHLHDDLQNHGVRCYLAAKHMKPGDPIRPTIDEAIRTRDKLLLILSKHSIVSQWVEQEVETALAQEHKTGRTIVFPIRIDNAIQRIETGWPTFLSHTRNIGDFTRWKRQDDYQQVFKQLLEACRPKPKQKMNPRSKRIH